MFRKRKIKNLEIYPDEIFMDSKNIPAFDIYRFEGKLEKPISKNSFLSISIVFIIIGIFFLTKLFSLQILDGKIYAERSENNRLRIVLIQPNRGIIYDRKGERLAWNGNDSRLYADLRGLSHVLGYVGLPSEQDLKDKNVSYEAIIGKEAIEKKYQEILGGKPGFKILEMDAENNIVSESTQTAPTDGENINLAIDSKLQSRFFEIMESVIKERGFQGGAGMVIDINNGEVLSCVSYPEYNSEILSKGEPKEKINDFIQDENKPFLNRTISGLYAPGSSIKPLIALAALNEGIILPQKQIYSAGSISLPNPFFPDKKNIFHDWKAHGWVDMRRAIAVSSDVYFYEIGGGFEEVKGLGINKIEDYAKRFGLGIETGIDLIGEEKGFIPNPEWKTRDPNDPIWRIGDTYNISIGQGAFQVTPLQMAVLAATIANDGKIIKPSLISKGEENLVFRTVNIPKDYFKVVKEGMRMAVLEGTAAGINVPFVDIAAKTGTAELGPAKTHVNSWIIGFFPYEKPRFAFSIVLEKGSAQNLIGATFVARQLFEWMSVYTPEYLSNN